MAFADELGARTIVNQYEIDMVPGVVIHIDGVPSAPDGDVMVTMTSLDDLTVIFVPRIAVNPAIGVYETQLQSAESAQIGIWKLTWTYDVSAVPQTFVSIVEVIGSSPEYQALSEEMQGLVEKTWIRFSDLFDSPFGGPHLQVYFQASFGRNRMAQLLDIALGTLNTSAQPTTTYNLTNFPLNNWGPFLEKSLYIEGIKHLIRSYTEQPQSVQVTVARLDRRDYMDRWRSIYDMEKAEFDDQMEVFKIAHMGLGRPHVLVSGGVYGSYGPTRFTTPARPRYYYRFY